MSVDWFNSIDWTPEAVTAAATIALAFLTLILAGGTVFLWRATRSLVKESEKTAKHQLRAYIAAYPHHISSFDEQHAARASFRIVNHGQTPAYNVKHHTMVVVAPHPLPPNYVFPKIISSPGPPMVIAPHNSFTGYKSADAFFTPEQIIGIIDETLRIYVHGEVRYDTIFHKKCWTTFSASVEGDKTNREKLASNHLLPDLEIKFDMSKTGNDADKK